MTEKELIRRSVGLTADDSILEKSADDILSAARTERAKVGRSFIGAAAAALVIAGGMGVYMLNASPESTPPTGTVNQAAESSAPMEKGAADISAYLDLKGAPYVEEYSRDVLEKYFPDLQGNDSVSDYDQLDKYLSADEGKPVSIRYVYDSNNEPAKVLVEYENSYKVYDPVSLAGEGSTEKAAGHPQYTGKMFDLDGTLYSVENNGIFECNDGKKIPEKAFAEMIEEKKQANEEQTAVTSTERLEISYEDDYSVEKLEKYFPKQENFEEIDSVIRCVDETLGSPVKLHMVYGTHNSVLGVMIEYVNGWCIFDPDSLMDGGAFKEEDMSGFSGRLYKFDDFYTVRKDGIFRCRTGEKLTDHEFEKMLNNDISTTAVSAAYHYELPTGETVRFELHDEAVNTALLDWYDAFIAEGHEEIPYEITIDRSESHLEFVSRSGETVTITPPVGNGENANININGKDHSCDVSVPQKAIDRIAEENAEQLSKNGITLFTLSQNDSSHTGTVTSVPGDSSEPDVSSADTDTQTTVVTVSDDPEANTTTQSSEQITDNDEGRGTEKPLENDPADEQQTETDVTSSAAAEEKPFVTEDYELLLSLGDGSWFTVEDHEAWLEEQLGSDDMLLYCADGEKTPWKYSGESVFRYLDAEKAAEIKEWCKNVTMPEYDGHNYKLRNLIAAMYYRDENGDTVKVEVGDYEASYNGNSLGIFINGKLAASGDLEAFFGGINRYMNGSVADFDELTNWENRYASPVWRTAYEFTLMIDSLDKEL